MDTGVTTDQLNPATLVDSILANRNGSTVLIELIPFLALLSAMMGPSYATRAELYADLNWPAGAPGYVRGDATTAYNGVYKKAGVVGAGSWARIGDLPSGAIEAPQLAALEAAVALLAPRLSPALTGTPTAPTAAPGTNTLQLATTGFVQAAFSALIGGSPELLNTLNEFSAALANDPNFATTMASALASKAPLISPAFTATPTAPTAAPGTNTLQLATTAFIQAALAALGLGSAAQADVDDFAPQQTVEDTRFKHVWRDLDGNVLVGWLHTGDLQLGEMVYRRTLPGEGPFAAACADRDGNSGGGWLHSGRVRWHTETLDPAPYIDAGVLGTISDRRGWGSSLWRMTITDGGISLPYVTPKRAPLPNQAVVLDTSDVMEVRLGAGQSWRADMLAKDFIADLDEPQLVSGMRDEDGAVRIIATNDDQAGIFELIGARPSAATIQEGGYVCIDSIAAIACQRFRRIARVHLVPVIYVGHSVYPGYTTDQLMPGTEDPTTTPWTYGTMRVDQVADVAAKYGKTVNFRSIGWTQGVEIDGAGVDYYDSLVTVLEAYTTYLGGSPVMFISQNPLLRTETLGRQNSLRQLDWAEDEPRGYCIGPRYPYPMRDDIHHTARGYAKLGELEGYVSHLVLDKGVDFRPLQEETVTASGSTVVITTNDPAGSGALVRKTDLIEAATDDGFVIRVGGVLQTIASVTLSGLTITITLGAAITPGASVSVRSSFERVLGSAPTGHSAGWTNICVQAVPSVFFDDEYVDFYLSMIDKTITAT